MSKIFKTLAIIFVILMLCSTLVCATDINMNLDNPNQTETNTTEDPNSTSTNTLTDTNTTGGETGTETNDGSTAGTEDTFEQDNIGGTMAPSGVSSIAQENMSFSNVLNILVITVGVILILLAIAILIRLKG